MSVGFCVMFVSVLLVVIEAIVSYRNGNFWPSQVMKRWNKAGISFFTHGGMWGDLFLLPILFAFVIARYGKSWSIEQIVFMTFVGATTATANHLLLISAQTIPDPLGWQKEKWSILIALHLVYMSTYVALAGLFYFSPNVSVKAAVMVSVILGLHMMAGTHIPLGLLNLWHRWTWCPTGFLTNPGLLYLATGIWAGLTVLSWIAAGQRAGLSVAGIALNLVVVIWTIVKIRIVTDKSHG